MTDRERGAAQQDKLETATGNLVWRQHQSKQARRSPSPPVCNKEIKSELLEYVLDALKRLADILVAIEGADTHVTLAALAETGAWSGNHAG